MSIPFPTQNSEGAIKNHLDNIHLMDIIKSDDGIPLSSNRSKQMVTLKGKGDGRLAALAIALNLKEEDLESLSVPSLRSLARKRNVADKTEITYAKKDQLIPWLLGREPKPRVSASDKDMEQEFMVMFRRMIMLVSEEAFRLVIKRMQGKEGV